MQCLWKIPLSGATKRCSFCQTYHDNVLRSGLSKLLKQQEGGEFAKRCEIDSHVNYHYLNMPEKIERMRNLHAQVRMDRRKIHQMQSQLDKLIQTDGVKVNDAMNKDLLNVMLSCQDKTNFSDETFSTVFWAAAAEGSEGTIIKGIRWHPAIIQWCLYLHHKSSSCYSTL